MFISIPAEPLLSGAAFNTYFYQGQGDWFRTSAPTIPIRARWFCCTNTQAGPRQVGNSGKDKNFGNVSPFSCTYLDILEGK